MGEGYQLLCLSLSLGLSVDRAVTAEKGAGSGKDTDVL